VWGESECTRCAVAGGKSSFVVLWVTEGNHDPHSPRRDRRPSSAYLPTHPSTTHLPVMLFPSCKAVERDLPTQPLARTSLASPAKTPLSLVACVPAKHATRGYAIVRAVST
jgi:hypothetical protein